MISAELVKTLRLQTGAPVMDCKKALAECQGDLESAKEWLRKKGIATAIKKSDREASEGAIAVSCDKGYGVALGISSETDFVARSSDFQQLAQMLLDTALRHHPSSLQDMLAFTQDGETIENHILAMAGKLGENVRLKTVVSLEVAPGHVIGYVHSPIGPSLGSIGVLVALRTEAKDVAEIGKRIAMHIAACSPEYLTKIDAPEGAVDEVILHEQPFIFETDKKIKDVLKQAEATLGTPVEIAGMARVTLADCV